MKNIVTDICLYEYYVYIKQNQVTGIIPPDAYKRYIKRREYYGM